METKRWKTRAGEISVTSAGQGTPLLAVHGALSSGLSFMPLLESPPDGYRVIAMDLPGHGRSPAPDTIESGWGFLSARITALIEALNLTEVHLMGHSMGGGACAYTAGEHPALVKSLILLDSATQSFTLPFKGRIPQIPGIGELVFKYLYRRSMFINYFRDDVYFDASKINDERISTYYEGFHRNRASALNAVRTAADPLPVQQRLSKITCPTLVVWGKNDPLIPLFVAEQTVAQIPQATLAVIENCGHSPFDEQPAETLRLINSFWENQP